MAGPPLGWILIAAFLTPPALSPQAITRQEPSLAGQPQEVNELIRSATAAMRKGDYAAAVPRGLQRPISVIVEKRSPSSGLNLII
jgi:hypothetical protein